jgi:uracil-DNA glycosylase family 4
MAFKRNVSVTGPAGQSLCLGLVGCLTTQVYVAQHAPPVPGAPSALSTCVSPYPLAVEQFAGQVATVNPLPIVRYAHWQLNYPTPVQDSTTAANRIMSEYTACERCHLADRRTRVVFLRGNPEASIVCIGEGPGRTEDVQGVPFCGPAGRLEDGVLREAGFDPEKHMCWINLVGCRPCNSRQDADREPNLVEKVACSERTLGLLRAIRPRVVLCLGTQAIQYFFDESAMPAPNSWTRLAPDGHPDDWIMVGYARHPAYLLRVLPVAKMYKEYAGVHVTLLRPLRENALNAGVVTIPKVSTWRFAPRYLTTLQAPAVSSPSLGGRG